MVGSMGKIGAAGDNAAMESFFALLQKNVLDRRQWQSRQELRIAIVTWIERTYHRRRRQDALGRLTPIEYETIMTTAFVRHDAFGEGRVVESQGEGGKQVVSVDFGLGIGTKRLLVRYAPLQVVR